MGLLNRLVKEYTWKVVIIATVDAILFVSFITYVIVQIIRHGYVSIWNM